MFFVGLISENKIGTVLTNSAYPKTIMKNRKEFKNVVREKTRTFFDKSSVYLLKK